MRSGRDKEWKSGKKINRRETESKTCTVLMCYHYYYLVIKDSGHYCNIYHSIIKYR